MRCRIVGMPVVDTVDVGEQHERVGLHHLGDKSTELIVIGEHQLGNADRVVLVDNGKYVVLKHHRHAGLLVTVLFSWLKVLFHCQYLTNVDAKLTEQVVIQPYELDLSDSRKQLTLLHGVKVMADLQLAAP